MLAAPLPKNDIALLKARESNKNQKFLYSDLETCKYTVKPVDFHNDVKEPKMSSPKHKRLADKVFSEAKPHGADWLYGITEQLDGLRSYATGGTIKEICNIEELERIEDTGSSSSEQSQLGNLIRGVWNDSLKRFDCVEVGD